MYEVYIGRFLFKLKMEYYVYLVVIIVEIRILILGLFDGIMEFYDIGKGMCV